MLLLFTTVSEEAKDSELLDKLISQTAAGDGDAFEKLYRLTKASVYGYAMSILKHPQTLKMCCTIALSGYTMPPAAMLPGESRWRGY